MTPPRHATPHDDGPDLRTRVWCALVTAPGVRHLRYAWGTWRRHRTFVTMAPGSVWLGEAEDRRLAAVLRGDA